MSNVTVNRVTDGDKGLSPVFQEIEKRLDAARRRAFELFEGRGGEVGRDLEDWLQAEREIFGEAQLELQEKAGQAEIRVTMPGFSHKDTEVTATPSEIVIHARREEAEGETKRSVEVLRRFELPKPVRTDQITAKLEDGVLHVIAPYASQGMSAGSQVTVAVA